MLKKFKTLFLSLFRELFVYHSRSLEFRAKVLVVVIAANSRHGECEQEILKDIAYSTYKDESDRAEVLISAVNEYLEKIEDNTDVEFNYLIKMIEHEIKLIARYRNKIDLEQLQRFCDCTKDEEDRIYQQRVMEYLQGVKS